MLPTKVIVKKIKIFSNKAQANKSKPSQLHGCMARHGRMATPNTSATRSLIVIVN